MTKHVKRGDESVFDGLVLDSIFLMDWFSIQFLSLKTFPDLKRTDTKRCRSHFESADLNDARTCDDLATD